MYPKSPIFNELSKNEYSVWSNFFVYHMLILSHRFREQKVSPWQETVTQNPCVICMQNKFLSLTSKLLFYYS